MNRVYLRLASPGFCQIASRREEEQRRKKKSKTNFVFVPFLLWLLLLACLLACLRALFVAAFERGASNEL